MKKFLLLLVLCWPLKILAISASSYIAYDLDNDFMYYGENIDDERLIASITKIMTCIVAIENTDISKEITVGEEVLKAYGSAIYLSVGEKLKIEDLLYGLMLRSGNDASIEVAFHTAGSMAKFAQLMNEYAQKIGMKNSYFYNAHGLEEKEKIGNTSTAKDMALLTQYAMKNATFRKIFGTKKYVLKTNMKTYSWINKNKLLHSEDYITGGKTGYTKLAKRTLVTTASRNNLNIVIVTLNDGNDFGDHKNLYEKIYREYVAKLLVKKDKVSIKEDNPYKDDILYLQNDIYVPIKTNREENFSLKYELLDNKEYKDGDLVGYVNVWQDDKLIRREAIYVKTHNKTSLSWWQKFIRWLKW